MLAKHRLSETPQAEAQGASSGRRGQTHEVQRRVREVIHMPTLTLVCGEPDGEKDGKKNNPKTKNRVSNTVSYKFTNKKKAQRGQGLILLQFSANSTVMCQNAYTDTHLILC